MAVEPTEAAAPPNAADSSASGTIDKIAEEAFMDEMMMSTLQTVILKSQSKFRDAIKDE